MRGQLNLAISPSSTVPSFVSLMSPDPDTSLHMNLYQMPNK